MDIYKIGVSIALSNGVSPVLAIISRDLLGIHTKVKDIERQFGNWAKAVGGAAGIIGGTAILAGLGKMVDAGRELVHQQELMKISGMSNAEIQDSIAKSYEISRKLGTSTISENMKSIRELRMAFGDTADALKYLEIVRKGQTVVDSLLPGHGHGDQIFEQVKALEMKGLTTKPQEFADYIDKMVKAMVASGGKITAADFFGSFKFGRTSMLSWDENFITKYLPTLMQEMKSGAGAGGAGGPGNALMSMFSAVVAGQMAKTSAQEFLKLGMLDKSKVEFSKSGHIANVEAGAVQGTDLFQKNPYQWVQEVLVPNLQKHGFTTQEQIVGEIGRLFKNRTAGQIATVMALQGSTFAGEHSRMEKDAALVGKAQGLDAVDELKAKDPTTIMKAFHKQWDAMIEAIGAPMVAPAMEIMKTVTNVFTSISQFAGAHPEAIRIAAEGIAALAVALVALGAIALGSVIVGIVGIPGVIAAVVAALGTIAFFAWDSIKAGIATLKEAIEAVNSAVISVFTSIESFVHNLVTLPEHLKRLLPSFLGGGEPRAQKQSFVPPPANQRPIQVNSTVNMDGRKVGEAVTTHMINDGHGPAEGSPYPDTTRGGSSFDFALVN